MRRPYSTLLKTCFAGAFLLQTAAGSIVINEIHYDPNVKTELVEFIELYNSGGAAADLSGWQLADAVDYTLPDGTILTAGSYLVVAQNPAAFQAKFGISALGPWAGKLNNDGEKISLKNAGGDVEDKVSYQLGFPWPTVGDSPGHSIELIHPAFDNDLGGNWRSSINGSSPGISPEELFSSESGWKYVKGIGEASSPTTLWRELNFDDSSWSTGQAPIGYGEPGHVNTELPDMQGNYASVFLRKTFVVDNPSTVGSLWMEASYDDGFKAWINGVSVVNANISSAELAYNGTANRALESLSYNSFILSNPESYLVTGTNVIAIQAHNASIGGSSDFWFDARLVEASGSANKGPTPGEINTAYALNAPPQIRQVEHAPKQPISGQSVVVMAKVTDMDGMSSVSLDYQVVHPGNYIELTDPAYTNDWTTRIMTDNGLNGDAMAGDSIYTATIPAQQNRRLVRYRLSAEDGAGDSVTVPYNDDPQPNFAYFCYDGVPAWQAAEQPGTTATLNFSTNVMQRFSAVHLISKNGSVEDATWFDRYVGDLYKWTGTLVYDGKVYDHIHYRARGGGHRYKMVKNMWKFDFNRGHDFQMRDDYGRKYSTKWTKLNLGASIQQGWTGYRGEQGMFESVGSRLFSLAGVESFDTAFLQFRIIDDAQEATSDQYEGDFWGLYLAVEQENGRFLDEHDLPDGNLYKMEAGSGELANIDPLGPTDKSDLNYILNNYTDASDAWWRANWNLEDFYSYQTIVQGIHHYDINGGKNFFYYRNPETGRWKVIPWDLDLTWADNMYLARWGGNNALASRILDASASGNLLQLSGDQRPEFRIEFRNRAREIRDLLFNPDQANQLIDEQARLLRDPLGGLSFLDADRCMWDYNPKMIDAAYTPALSDAGQGKFYQWPISGVSKDFNGCVQLLKNYVVGRSVHLDDLATDTAIPNTPTIVYTGDSNYPLNGLSFQCSAFSDPQDSGSFAAMQWRAGEVLNTAAHDPTEPPPYEITAKWESGELTGFNPDITIPADALKVGRAYRVRVRMKDNSGRWSHWSNPVQFITAESSTAGALVSHLRISEVMYDPTGGNDYEFIELHNTDTNLPLNLSGAAFTSGVDYNFPDGTTIDPGGHLLVAGNTNNTFHVHYGLSAGVAFAGPYSGKLANGGEELKLKTAPGGSEIASFEYGNGRTWPLAAAGAGHSLVPIEPSASGQATGALDYPGNWRASTYINGSPGTADPVEPAATVVLNEITAHTDYSTPSNPEYDSDDWIELRNTTGTSISLDDWYLSDDPANPAKWAIPATNIPAGGRLVFNEVDDFHSPITIGFGLDKAGEQVLLSHLPGTAADRVVDAIGFKGQENGSSLSRYADGTGFWYATAPSRNIANHVPYTGLRLTEIMYQPTLTGTTDNTHDEFIEIYNPTPSAITMQNVDEAWRLNGGIEYTFPDNTTVPAGETLLVISFNPSDSTASNAFVTAYGISNNVRFFGPYSGKLGNRSDRVTLEKPQLPDAIGDAYSWVIEDEIIYGNQNPWPGSAAGTGHTLARVSINQHGLDPLNWHATTPTPGLMVADSDGDGIPDRWENTHSLNPANPADAALDSDGDGLTNLQEYLCGTNPNDLTSVLKLEWIAPPALQFSAIAGKSYSIQWRTALDSGTWQTLTNMNPGSGTTQVSVPDPSSSTNGTGYYRLLLP